MLWGCGERADIETHVVCERQNPEPDDELSNMWHSPSSEAPPPHTSGTLAALHCLQRAKSCQVARSEIHSPKHFQRSRLVCFKKSNHKLPHIRVMEAQEESLFLIFLLRNIPLILLHCNIFDGGPAL